jgi:hypothetical protein
LYVFSTGAVTWKAAAFSGPRRLASRLVVLLVEAEGEWVADRGDGDAVFEYCCMCRR